MSRDLTQEEEDLVKKMGNDNAPLVMKDVRCPGAYLRPQHGKSHGCLKARFTVRADLAPEFQKGVFIPGKAYDGVARFSAGVQFDDSQDDAHGLALKLDGVNPDGAQAWANDAARKAGVQDFVMMNRDTFPFYDFKSYERINDVMCANFLANRASMSDNEFENFWGQLRGYSEMAADLAVNRLVGRFGRWLRGGKTEEEEKNDLLKAIKWAAHFGSRPLTHALKENYWGTQPFAFGDPGEIVRYVLRRRDVRAQFPAPGPDAIRKRLAIDAATEQKWEFCIIRLPDRLKNASEKEKLDCTTPWACDDPGKKNDDTGAWQNAGDPWHPDVVPVADLVIHDPEAAVALSSDDPAEVGPALGQDLVFTPWHALKAHEPLGEINLARRDVYARMSKLRLDMAKEDAE